LDETAPVEAPESDDESAFAELSAAPEEEPFTEDEDDELIYYGDDVEPEYGDAQTKEEAAALDFLHRILQYFDMRETIETTWEEEHLRIDIDGENAGQIIGHRGETLNALQYLTSVAVNRVSDRHVRVLLDVAGYKARRSNSLRKTALRYAGEVVHLQKEFVMEPMNAAERRVVHFALQDFSGVTTESEGEEPNRCVVIIPTGEQ
jgi:spoIIIJ-associated protein